MDPFFITSFRRTMMTGALMTVIGLFTTFARGKESLKYKH
jgi:hypothetical protein